MGHGQERIGKKKKGKNGDGKKRKEHKVTEDTHLFVLSQSATIVGRLHTHATTSDEN